MKKISSINQVAIIAVSVILFAFCCIPYMPILFEDYNPEGGPGLPLIKIILFFISPIIIPITLGMIIYFFIRKIPLVSQHKGETIALLIIAIYGIFMITLFISSR